jgi:hypothetical protein
MPTIDGLFACGYDVIVFVDESDAGPASEDGSRFVLGRAVTPTDRAALRCVSSLLAADQAEAWHASQRGGTNLFTSTRSSEILGALLALGASLHFNLRSTPSELAALRESYRNALQTITEPAHSWPNGIGVGHEPMLLLAFLMLLRRHLAWRQHEGALPGCRALVICDQQSWWLSPRPGES